MDQKLPQAIRNTLSILISSQFIIAISALCLSFETILMYGLQIEFLPVFGFVFFGSLGVYNLAYLGSTPLRNSVFINRKGKFITSSISFIVAFFLIFFLPPQTVVISGIAGLFVLIYLYKLKWKKKVFQTRNIPLVKNVILAFIWAVFSVLVPLSAYQHEFVLFGGNDCIIFLRRFFFILAIAIPYDIRDYKEDLKSSLQTLPVKFGIGKSKMIALVSLSCFALLVLYNSTFSDKSGIFMPQLNIAFYLSSIITACVILYTNASRKKYYFSVFIDGTMIIQFFLVLLNLKIGNIIIF